MPHDAARPRDGALDRALAIVRRRLWLAHAARGAASGLSLAVVASMGLHPRGTAPAIIAGLAVASIAGIALTWHARRERRDGAVAARIERTHPDFHNLLITAVELRAHPERASDWMRARVRTDAESRLGAIDRRRAAPVARAVAWAVAAAALWLAVLAGLPSRGVSLAKEAAAAAIGRANIGESRPWLVAVVEPPAYTGLPASELVAPRRLDVVRGTMVRLRVHGDALPWRVRFGSSELEVRREGQTSAADLRLTESGYFAVEPAGPAGDMEAAARRILLPVSVRADDVPVIRIETPARDLLLPSTASGLAIAATAKDDFALDMFELRYTKVSGSGEQFEFEEGVLPFGLTRSHDRAWTGRGELPLRDLGLAPGDSVVYRAVARDRRPGDAGLASSDTFFVEIREPGQIPLEGMEMPPDQERYALSQQMVLLKIERLRARERAMTRAAVEEEAAAIAAEQRAVRANFIFLMGGHVEDEFEEAEQSHEIQEGRLENSARRDISQAIHHMTAAEHGLTAIDTGRALPPARAAVEALQRAFGRHRYILRSLGSRGRIDPSRRLSGVLTGAAGWDRTVSPPTPDRQAIETGAMLVDLLDLAASLERHAGLSADTRLARLAERALGVAPGSREWESVSARLLELREAAAAGRPPRDLARLLSDAIAPVVKASHAGARGPRTEGTAPATGLRSAWADERRR